MIFLPLACWWLSIFFIALSSLREWVLGEKDNAGCGSADRGLWILDLPAPFPMWQVRRMDLYAAALALGGVLLLGILQDILLAALASALLLLARASQPHVLSH